MKLWLEVGPTKILKKFVHQVTTYPTTKRIKTIECQSKDVIKANTLAMWNKHGMMVSTIQDIDKNKNKTIVWLIAKKICTILVD